MPRSAVSPVSGSSLAWSVLFASEDQIWAPWLDLDCAHCTQCHGLVSLVSLAHSSRSAAKWVTCVHRCHRWVFSGRDHKSDELLSIAVSQRGLVFSRGLDALSVLALSICTGRDTCQTFVIVQRQPRAHVVSVRLLLCLSQLIFVQL